MIDLGDTISTVSTLVSEDATNTDFVVKVIHRIRGTSNRETRRFQLRHMINDESGMVSLEKFASLFREATGLALPRILYYTDCDGDIASLSTTRELHDAVFQCLDKTRLHLFESKPKDQDNQTAGQPTQPTAADKLSSLMNAAPDHPTEYNGVLFDRADVVKHLVNDLDDHVTSSFAPPCKTMRLSGGDFVLWEYNINGQQVHSKHFAIGGFLLIRTANFYSLLLANAVYSKLRNAVGAELYYKSSFSHDLAQIYLKNVGGIVAVVGKWVGNPASRKFVAMHEMGVCEIRQKMEANGSHNQVLACTAICTVSRQGYDTYLHVSGAFLLSTPDGKGVMLS